MKLVLALLFAVSLFAESKTEADLRQRLMASERANTALVANLAKLNADIKERALATAARLKAAETTATHRSIKADRERSQTANVIQSNAEEARAAAASAEAANRKLIVAAIEAKSQADQLLKVSAHSDYLSNTTLIVSVFGFLSLIVQLSYKSYADCRDH